MEYLFNEMIEVDPESLFKIVETLINLDAENHWLTKKELHTDRSKDNLFRIFFYDEVIGNLLIIRHNSSTSRVAIWVQSLLPNKTYKTDLSDNESLESIALRIIQRLVAGIRKEIPEIISLDPGRQSYHPKGGPKSTPLEDKINFVRGWNDKQGKMSQESYCKLKGIGASTLRSWMRDPEVMQKLSSS